MTAFLLLVGLALFVSGGAMYLAHAARHEPRWVAGSIFFPFVVPLYYRRNWEELYPAGLLQGAGFVMTLAGALMMLFQSVQPEGLAIAPAGQAFSSDTARQDSGFVDSARALNLLGHHQAGTPVAGRVHGRDFHPDRVEWIDNTLRMTEGPTFLPDREVAIHFPAESLTAGDRVKQTIAPGMQDVPEVEVTWRGDDGMPASETFHGGYRLQLELAPLLRNKLSGYIQMMLPDRGESFVAGDITAITSHLRFNGDVVDRHFDHEDTLKFVAEEYLRSIYPEADIDTVSFNNLVLDPLAGIGETLASVKLKDGRVGNHVIKVAKSEIGWNVLVQESAAASEAAGYKPVYSVMAQVAAGQPQASAPRAAKPAASASRKPAERTLAFDQLGSLAGQGAVVEYRSGRQEQGVLRGMNRDRLVVDTMKGGGVVQYLVAEKELARLRMNSGEVINLAGYTATASAAAQATSEGESPSPAAAAAHVEFAGTDVTPYLNRVVKVVTRGGKSTIGVLRSARKEGLVLETQVGAGKVDYTVLPDDFGSISYASQ